MNYTNICFYSKQIIHNIFLFKTILSINNLFNSVIQHLAKQKIHGADKSHPVNKKEENHFTPLIPPPPLPV